MRLRTLGVAATAGGAAVVLARAAVRRHTAGLGVRSYVRWAARHGSARAAVRVGARLGDPFGRLAMEPALHENPHPLFDQLRDAPAVAGKVSVVVARHDRVAAHIRDPKLRSGFPLETLPGPAQSLLAWADDPRYAHPLDRPAILVTNGPDHVRYRRLAMKAFTARAVNALRPGIEAATATLLDEMQAQAQAGRSVDAITDFADILPVQVIAEILGVPVEMRSSFRSWATDVVPTVDIGVPYRHYRNAELAVEKLNAWMLDHLHELRREPGDNLFSAMIAAADEEETRDGVTLDEHGLLVNGTLLLGAGFETTVNLIGNGIDLLLRHPDQLALLRADPDLWSNAVEEVLRYESPIQNTFRYVDARTEIDGVPLAKGQLFALLLAAANRDPAVFTDPHVFDVRRANARDHVSFGAGPHFCVGSTLARIEGEVALRQLFERFPDIAAAGPSVPRPTRLIHGLASLPVSLGLAAPVAATS